MIESYYWKEDLLEYVKSFRPVAKPPRWTERLQVNFEKDVIIAFFMIRKLIESKKLSSKTTKYKAQIFRSPAIKKIDNKNFRNIDELYDFEREERVYKNVNFLCNQLIHGGAIYAYREKDRNWGGIYTCSDFERDKYVYRLPLVEIRKVLKLAGSDYPETITITFDKEKDDFTIRTN